MVRFRSVCTSLWSDFHKIMVCLRLIIVKFLFYCALILCELWLDFHEIALCLRWIMVRSVLDCTGLWSDFRRIACYLGSVCAQIALDYDQNFVNLSSVCT